MPDPDPVIRTIPLDRLELASANVRRTPAGQTAFAELKASITAHGLLENLVARRLGPGENGAGRYAVIAGGRRLTALVDLAREGVLVHDFPVPCRIVDDPAAESELSLAENVVRVAMHPADQMQAFGVLADAGAAVADIAARFGVPERTVEQRLRLGGAAPELLDAYREGAIDMDTLMAFAVTADRGRQMAVWEQVRDQGYRPSAWQIKRMLTEDRVPATSATARFVGVEAYEAAGGAVTRDLFADEDERGIWLDDPDLLHKLATDKLQAAADELATRWKWAEARIDADWTSIARFGRVRPQPGEPTGEEKAEIARLDTRHDELMALDDDDWTEELTGEAGRLEERREEIDDAVKARAVYRPRDVAVAGCIVTVGNNGRLQLIQGLVRPGDMPPREQGAGTATDNPADDNGGCDGEDSASDVEAPTITGPNASTSDPEAEARKEAGVGIGLSDDLRSIRTALIKAHLANDFDAAFDLLLFQMGRAVFTNGYHADALDIAVRETPDRPPLRANDDEFADISPGEAMLRDRSSLPFDWLTMEDHGEAFAALQALPDAAKRVLFAACVARTVKGQLAFEHGARPELEATVARLGIDFAPYVRPTAEVFWSRVRKDRMLAVARDTLGAGWAQAHGKAKKADLAAAMEDAFAAGDGVPAGLTPEGHAAALAWTPPGFRAFDKGSTDDGDGSGSSPEVEPSPADLQQAGKPENCASEQAKRHGDSALAETPRPRSVVESLDSPAVAERLAAARARPAAAAETVTAEAGDSPTANAGPAPPDHDAVRITIANGDRDVSSVRERVPAPHRGNGHDAHAEPLEIPAFLRRVP